MSYENNFASIWENILANEIEDPNFTLKKFVKKHNIDTHALLCLASQKIDEILLLRRDFNINEHKVHISRFNYVLLSLMYKDVYAYNAIIFRQLQITVALSTLIPHNTKYLSEDEKMLFNNFINYCKNGHIYVPSHITETVSQYFMGRMSMDELASIVDYHFKYNINKNDVISHCIRQEYVSLFIHLIKSYRLGDVRLNFQPKKLLSKKQRNMFALLDKNANVLNLEEAMGVNYPVYQPLREKYCFAYILMWLDDKQRFTKPKDTTLLHSKPLVTHIHEFAIEKRY